MKLLETFTGFILKFIFIFCYIIFGLSIIVFLFISYLLISYNYRKPVEPLDIVYENIPGLISNEIYPIDEVASNHDSYKMHYPDILYDDEKDYLEVREYRYYFCECTGLTSSIRVNGEYVSICFNKKKSNINALESLYGLSYKILYPFSDGQIRIIGQYNPETKMFVLYHWYLEPHYLGPIFSNQGRFFTEKDFSIKLKEDPRIYNQNIYKEFKKKTN